MTDAFVRAVITEEPLLYARLGVYVVQNEFTPLHENLIESLEAAYANIGSYYANNDTTNSKVSQINSYIYFRKVYPYFYSFAILINLQKYGSQLKAELITMLYKIYFAVDRLMPSLVEMLFNELLINPNLNKAFKQVEHSINNVLANQLKLSAMGNISLAQITTNYIRLTLTSKL